MLVRAVVAVLLGAPCLGFLVTTRGVVSPLSAGGPARRVHLAGVKKATAPAGGFGTPPAQGFGSAAPQAKRKTFTVAGRNALDDQQGSFFALLGRKRAPARMEVWVRAQPAVPWLFVGEVAARAGRNYNITADEAFQAQKSLVQWTACELHLPIAMRSKQAEYGVATPTENADLIRWVETRSNVCQPQTIQPPADIRPVGKVKVDDGFKLAHVGFNPAKNPLDMTATRTLAKGAIEPKERGKSTLDLVAAINPPNGIVVQ